LLPESLGGEHEPLTASRDDLSAGFDDDLVGCDSILVIFELGGESAAGFSALLGYAEVSQDVAAGVAHQAGEVHQEVVGGCFGT
jgi:hypothetical protein